MLFVPFAVKGMLNLSVDRIPAAKIAPNPPEQLCHIASKVLKLVVVDEWINAGADTTSSDTPQQRFEAFSFGFQA